jgi:hypothetical protein
VGTTSGAPPDWKPRPRSDQFNVFPGFLSFCFSYVVVARGGVFSTHIRKLKTLVSQMLADLTFYFSYVPLALSVFNTNASI